MKFKRFSSIQIWFLDNDLNKSAQYLTDKMLNKTIVGCCQALISAYMLQIGMKNKKFYNYFFSKDRKKETLSRFFPCWPLKRMPSFNNFNSRASKWTRKCKEHFDYVKRYMEALCIEHEYRTGKQHTLAKFLEWLDFDALPLDLKCANLSKIVLEWKSLNIKYRRKNILEGYRLQYKNMLKNCGVGIDDFSKRDVPEWLMDNSSSWLQ